MKDLTPEQKLQAVYEAARGLCQFYDWNRGHLAKGWREKLLKAVNAVEPVPDLKAKLKADVAS